jgi:hypothetical protein
MAMPPSIFQPSASATAGLFCYMANCEIVALVTKRKTVSDMSFVAIRDRDNRSGVDLL